MKNFLFVALFVFLSTAYLHAQDKVNVILIGTYHFNNPGNDAAKVVERNILSEKNQLGLEDITNAIIHKNKPDQIFVESAFSKRNHLNQLYQLYLNNEYNKFTDTLQNKRLKRFYTEGETFQLAFRLAKKSGHHEIFSIDTLIEMRFDLLLKLLNADPELKKEYDIKLAELSKSTNKAIEKEKLRDVFLALNEDHHLAENIGFYLSFFNRIGIKDDYFGSKLVSDWYKRNLFMYANFQNQLNKSAKTVVVLVGEGHASLLKDFLKNDDHFNLIELNNAL